MTTKTRKTGSAKSTEKCLFPRCEGEAKTRGLCGSHYGSCRRLVLLGKVSWPDLEERGKCFSSQRASTTSWFLNGA